MTGRTAFLLLALVCAMAPLPSHADDPVVARGTRLEGDTNRTRLILELDQSVQPRIFTLADPYRVVIDLPNVVFEAAVPSEQNQARGLVTAYRHGLIAPGRSRIVIDSANPIAVEDVKPPRAADGSEAQLIIQLVPTSRDAFMRGVARERAAAEKAPSHDTVPPDTGDRRPVITIDPGHGGIDSGARSVGGEEEKKVVLDFAVTLRRQLEASGRYRVVMTRADDSFIPLSERVRIARDNQANLFISIHADSLSDPFGVRGATVYTLSERASDHEAARLAEKENRADVIAGVDLTSEPDEVAGILIDLARRETQVFSSRFAKTLVTSVKDSIRMNKNGLRSAGFLVLKAPDVPSVLLELGYMSNKEDLKLLTSQDWRDAASASMVSAIDAFFGARSGRGAATGVN